MKSIANDIKEYHYHPSCFDGFNSKNLEWDQMEYEQFAEITGVQTVEVHML